MITQDQLASWLAERLDHVATRPEMWGTGEMVEATYLNFLEVLWLLQGENAKDRAIAQEWQRFFQERHGLRGPEMACVHLGGEELVETLVAFRASLGVG